MPIIPCWLTNQTGAIIRFRPAQLADLPDEDVDLQVELPNGRVVGGRFHPHPGNPYVAGVEVCRFIQERVPERSREPLLIDVTGSYWRLYEIEDTAVEVRRHRVSSVRATSGDLRETDLGRILRNLDDFRGRTSRRSAYQRLLRPPGLRRMILELFGAVCQIEGCTSARHCRCLGRRKRGSIDRRSPSC